MNTNMKKYFWMNYILILALVAGCDDKLDIAPRQSIDQSTALSTEKDVMVTLVGTYDALQLATTYGGDMMVLSELIGNTEDILFTGTFAALSDVWRAEMTATNNNATITWRDAYVVINRANNVLSGVDKVTSSPATKNRVEGEARFIRASMYFELVRLFAKTWDDGNNTTNPGVPLILTPTTTIGPDSFQARATVAQVYQQILTDLTAAETLLPTSNTIYANQNAATAMIARVKLAQGVNGSTPEQVAALAEARNAASRVIASGRNSLSATVNSAWFTFINNAGNSPSEYVFSMKVTNQDGTNSLNTYFGTNAGAGTAGRSDCKITAAHLAKYETGDARRGYFAVVGGRNYTRKHLDRFGNVPVARIAEMYLIRAETNFRLATTVGDTPLNDINRIRTRAGLANLASIPTVQTILTERYLELAFEGSRLHDVKRTRGTQSALAWNNPRLIFPIPQREIDVNKNLVQNVGY
jgi:starch-binding outer membrane protein, SusD/RagB family